MNCKDLEELLSAYADGELSRTQREFIEEHLSGCADCRETLSNFLAAGRLLSTLGAMPPAPDIKETTISKIKATNLLPGNDFRRWFHPILAIGMAVIILAVLLVAQPWEFKTPAASAASIVRESPQVQAFFDDEQIEEVEVTTKVIGNEGEVLVVLVKTETRTAAAEVNLKKKIVTEIVRVNVPDFQPGDEQKAVDIAKADPGVQELLAQGGVVKEVHLGHSIDIAQFTGPDGVTSKEGTVTPMAFIFIDLKGKAWSVAVDLDGERVMGIGKPSAVMILVHIHQFVATVAAPILLVLSVLLLFGLAYKNKIARASAGAASLVLGIIGLFIELYGMSSIWWRLILIVGVPAVGLIIGIADLRQQIAKRWISITGIVFCALALAFNLFHAIIVPDGNVGTIIGVAVVITGIIVYALYEQIRKVPRKWWRPVIMAGAAAAVLALAIVQPWGGPLEPESVMAKAYTATEGLQSYRLTYYGTTTAEGETSSHFMEVAFAAPDRYHIHITNNDETDEFIIIGNTQYITKGSFTGASIMVISDSFSSILSKQATLDLLDELTGLQVLPEETIDGVRCLHYLGKLDMEKRIEETKKNIQEFNADSDAHAVTDEQMEKIFEQMRSIDVTHEIWIEKDDYLIRQIKTEQRGPADKNGLLSVNMTMQYSDFNRPITIEPPLDADGKLLDGWRLYSSPSQEISFNCQTHFHVAGDDPAHRQIDAMVTVTNVAMGATANNVRVELRNSEIIKDNDATPWTNAVPSNPEPIVLERGESETFQASWKGNLSHIAGDKLDELLERTVIKITYSTSEGDEVTRMYTAGGAVYPSAVPPASPPEK